MKKIKSVANRCAQLMDQIRKSGCAKPSFRIRTRKGNSAAEQLLSENLELKVGGSLHFSEVWKPENGEYVCESYSYHFAGANVVFRYDKDPKAQRPIVHELCHLHVCNVQLTQGLAREDKITDAKGEELRFKSHDTSFEEVFQFIVECFCR